MTPISSVPGVGAVSVTLDDHYTGTEINAAVARGGAFADAFPGETRGDLTALRPTCAGWTLPVQTFQLRRSSGSLEMSGHRYEIPTPYPWVWQMQDAIGGDVFTVNDFVHGSVPFVPECAAHLVTYFNTGSPGGTSCQGLQPDSQSTAAASATVASASASATASMSAATSASSAISAISGASSLSWPNG